MKYYFAFLICCFTSYLNAQSIIGIWSGNLNMNGIKLPLVVHITNNGDSLTSKMDSPAQGVKGIPVDKTTFVNSQLQMSIKSISAFYTGLLQGDSIAGTFTQMGVSHLLNLKRGIHYDTLTQATIVKTPTDLKQAVDRVNLYLNYLVANNRIAGGISIFKNGKEIYNKYFGQDSLGATAKDKQTFQIGSVTKTMTATMIYQLAEQKKLSLTDKLSKYYPQVPGADSITIDQLLDHTSGLGDYVVRTDSMVWLTRPASEAEIMNTIISQGLVFAPGADQRYSNSGYWLLTGILKKVTGKSYAQNLAERILQPLAMRKTFSADSRSRNVFPSYNFSNGWNNVNDFYFSNVTGVGDVAATPDDMNRFINALFNGKIINAQSLEKMKPATERMGHGLYTIPFHNLKFYGHSGGTYGTHSLLLYRPQDSVSFMYSVNASRLPFNDFSIGLLSAFYGVDFKYPVFAKPCAISIFEMKKFEGNYLSVTPPLEMKIFVKENGMFAQIKGQPSFPLNCYEKNKFEYSDADVKIHFTPETNKLILLQRGIVLEFLKK